MAEEQQEQDAVDSALANMPGLRESMEQRQTSRPAETAGAEVGEESDPAVAPKRPQVEDSDAVAEALNQIPGLRERTGG